MTFKYFFFVCSSGVLATVYCCATSKVQNILAISEAVMGLLKMVLQSHTNTALWKDEAVLILLSYWLKWLKCVLMGQQIPLFFFNGKNWILQMFLWIQRPHLLTFWWKCVWSRKEPFYQRCAVLGGGSVGHCNQQLEERPFPGEKKIEWLEEFSPTFQMFLVGCGGGRKVIVVEIDNRLLIGHRDFLVTKVFTKVWALWRRPWFFR